MNVGMSIEATTKQKTTDSSKYESTRTKRRISSRKRKRTKHLPLNPKKKFDEEFSSGEGDIMEDLETPCEGITRSIKD